VTPASASPRCFVPAPTCARLDLVAPFAEGIGRAAAVDAAVVSAGPALVASTARRGAARVAATDPQGAQARMAVTSPA
jgi:hypothetical protein